MTQDTFDRLQLWAKAIESDLVTASQWIDWAVGVVGRAEQPDAWVWELATAATKESALAIVYAARPGSTTTLRWLDDLMLSLGVQYARYKNRRLTLVQLLAEAGELADRKNASDPSCETFYALLTDLEQGRRSPAEVEVVLDDLLGPPLRYANDAFARISVSLV